MSTSNLSALCLLIAGVLVMFAAATAGHLYLASLGAAAILAGRFSHSPSTPKP